MNTNIPTFPTFTTNRLLFRQLQLEDAQGIYQLFSDPEAMKLDGGQTLGNIYEAQQFIQHYSQPPSQTDFIRWAVTSKNQRTFYGTAGFHNWDRDAQTAEIGGECRRQFWNKGIATEAYQALISFGFNAMNLNRIYAYVNPKNSAAKKILEKAPFRKEGYLRQAKKWGGRFVDIEVYGLLKSDIKS